MDYRCFLNLIEAAHKGHLKKFDICAAKFMDGMVLEDAEIIKKIKAALSERKECSSNGTDKPESVTNEITEASNINHNGHEYVDLCLPSGTLWAKCNVGAEKESDFGGYYQWGGTEDFTNACKTCTWKTYPLGSNYNNLIKYNARADRAGDGKIDNKTELELSDDVAHQLMGGDWHIPSQEQLQELLDNTTSEWTTVNGVYGRRFTSKFNCQSIFIPAAGWREGVELNAFGKECRLWSSSLFQTRPDNAWYLYFNSAYNDIFDFCRCCGWSVRGVIG